MERFSYALEFYNNKFYDLNNVNLFKRKVNEAERIEEFFSSIIPNIDCVRMYILRSYRFNKKYNFKNRINYIKGLIFADNVIDFNDIIEFESLLEDKILIEEKKSVWKNKGFIEDTLNEDFLEGEFENNDLDLIELFSSYVPSFSNEEDINKEELEENEKMDPTILQMLCDNDDDYDDEFEDASSDFVPIGACEKINQFIENKDKIINEIIERKSIDVKSEKMVRKGIKDWLDFSINSIQNLYNLKIKSLKLKDENISKYL